MQNSNQKIRIISSNQQPNITTTSNTSQNHYSKPFDLSSEQNYHQPPNFQTKFSVRTNSDLNNRESNKPRSTSQFNTPLLTNNNINLYAKVYEKTQEKQESKYINQNFQNQQIEGKVKENLQSSNNYNAFQNHKPYGNYNLNCQDQSYSFQNQLQLEQQFNNPNLNAVQNNLKQYQQQSNATNQTGFQVNNNNGFQLNQQYNGINYQINQQNQKQFDSQNRQNYQQGPNQMSQYNQNNFRQQFHPQCNLNQNYQQQKINYIDCQIDEQKYKSESEQNDSFETAVDLSQSMTRSISYQCQYCNQRVFQDIVQLDCFHFYHPQCFKEYLINQIRASNYRALKCHCQKKISESQIKNVLNLNQNSDLIKGLLQAQIENIFLFKKEIYNFQQCQNCKFFWVKGKQDTTFKNYYCINCDKICI